MQRKGSGAGSGAGGGGTVSRRPYPPKLAAGKTWQRKTAPKGYALARRIVKKIADDPRALYFLKPVDEVADCAPDYSKVVKRPMDLTSIQYYIDCEMYESADEVKQDVLQVFDNCRLYNSASPWASLGRVLLLHAELLRHTFEEEWLKDSTKFQPSMWLEERRRLQDDFAALKSQHVHSVVSLLSLGSPEALNVRRMGVAGIRVSCDVLKISQATLRACTRYAHRKARTHTYLISMIRQLHSLGEGKR